MKKAINSFGSNEINKRNELKIKFKELSNLVTKVEVVERLLVNEKTTEGLNHCLMVCEEIKNLQKIPGEIYNCKTLIKLNQKVEAMNKLRNLASHTFGYLNIYFIIIDLIKDPRELKIIGKEMLKKCQNIQIPVSLKIQAYIKYSKILCLNSKPDKAITLLQYIARIFPEFPLCPLPYTNNLRLSMTENDLKCAAHEAIKASVYNEIDNEIETPKEKSKLKNENKKSASLLKAGEDSGKNFSNSPKRIFSDVVRKSLIISPTFSCLSVDVTKNDKSLGSLVTILEGLRASTRITGENVNPDFIISSDVQFLYVIGKICMKYNIYLEDGFCALQDFLNVLQFKVSSEQNDIKIHKALYVKA